MMNEKCADALRVLKNCIEIPEGATNGDMIKAMFPNQKVSVFADGYGHKMISVKFTETEWNAPYKREEVE